MLRPIGRRLVRSAPTHFEQEIFADDIELDQPLPELRGACLKSTEPPPAVGSEAGELEDNGREGAYLRVLSLGELGQVSNVSGRNVGLSKR